MQKSFLVIIRCYASLLFFLPVARNQYADAVRVCRLIELWYRKRKERFRLWIYSIGTGLEWVPFGHGELLPIFELGQNSISRA